MAKRLLSDTHKAALIAGRKNKRLGIVKEKVVKVVSTKHRGRPAGIKLTQEQKDKRRMGMIQKRNKIEKIEEHEKPILNISKEWQTGFDFWNEVRNVLRPLHRYLDCKNIERAIVNKNIWENREEILKILDNYFILE